MVRHQFESDEDSESGDVGGNLVVRVVETLRDLRQPGGYDVTELAERRGLAKRSMRRMLTRFQEAGVLLLEEMDNSGRKLWKLDPRDPFNRLPTPLDPFGFFALFFATMQSSAVRAATGLSEVLEDLIDGYEKALGPKFRAMLLKLMLCVRPDDRHPYITQSPALVQDVLDAMIGDKICTVTYAAARTGGVENTYQILPLRMWPYDSATYVTHFSYLTNTLEVMNLSRLRKLTVTKKVGVRPSETEIDAFDRNSFEVMSGGEPVPCRFRFNAKWAIHAGERRWHHTMKMRKLKNGGVEVSFLAPYTPEMITYTIRFREGVVAVEPVELRDALYDLWQFLRRQYPKRSVPKPGKPDEAIPKGRKKKVK